MNISNLLHERELLKSRSEKMIYGSIEIREHNGSIFMFILGMIELKEVNM